MADNTNKDSTSWLKQLPRPSYNERDLFIIALIACLLWYFSVEMRHTLLTMGHPYQQKEHAAGVLFLLGSGVLLSVYHVFSERKKTQIEKVILLCFVTFLTGFAGLKAGIYAFTAGSRWFLPFALINLADALLLMLLFEYNITTENDVNDEPAGFSELLVGSGIGLAIFGICHFVLHFYWAETLSVCVAYATNINTRFAVPLVQKWLYAES